MPTLSHDGRASSPNVWGPAISRPQAESTKPDAYAGHPNPKSPDTVQHTGLNNFELYSFGVYGTTTLLGSLSFGSPRIPLKPCSWKAPRYPGTSCWKAAVGSASCGEGSQDCNILTCEYMHNYVSPYVHVCVCVYVYTHIHIFIYNKYRHVCTCVYLYTHTNSHMQTRLCIFIHIICTYLCACQKTLDFMPLCSTTPS